MDQAESEEVSKGRSLGESLERQHAGLDRHFRGSDGFGWFVQDPRSIPPEILQNGKFRIKTVDDLSNTELSVEGEKHKLAAGSFSIEMDDGTSGGEFIFSHPADIEEFLQKAEVENPKDLIGKEMISYWIGRWKKPMVGDRIVGIDLLGYRIPLSELIKGDQGK